MHARTHTCVPSPEEWGGIAHCHQQWGPSRRGVYVAWPGGIRDLKKGPGSVVCVCVTGAGRMLSGTGVCRRHCVCQGAGLSVLLVPNHIAAQKATRPPGGHMFPPTPTHANATSGGIVVRLK